MLLESYKSFTSNLGEYATILHAIKLIITIQKQINETVVRLEKELPASFKLFIRVDLFPLKKRQHKKQHFGVSTLMLQGQIGFNCS